MVRRSRGEGVDEDEGLAFFQSVSDSPHLSSRMVRVGFEVIHPSLLSVMCLSPRRRVVVSRCAVLVLSECERPEPPLAPFGGGRGLNLRAASIPTCQDL
jgi:hypothetical protein